MEYMVIDRQYLHTLNEAVNALIAEGWRPLGGPIVQPNGYLAQALIREQEETE